MSQQESRINKRIYAAFKLVPGVGVEPTHLAVSDFESDASANFAIRAKKECAHKTDFCSSTQELNFRLHFFTLKN